MVTPLPFRCLGVLFLGVGLSTVQGQPQAWGDHRPAAWFQEHPDPATWPEAAEALVRNLEEEYDRLGSAVFTRDGTFAARLDHVRWIHHGLAEKAVRNDPAMLKAFVEVGSRPELGAAWVRNLVADDRAGASLRILLRLQQAYPEDLAEFSALGLAHALVFDQPFPQFWPHHQVRESDIPRSHPDPVERFADLVRAQRAGQLELDPRKLGVHELRFVVDTDASLEELAWARKHVKWNAGKFAAAFRSIRYDLGRLNAGQFVWNFGPYTLEAIQTNGGICTDQAYFAWLAGKARGLPTLYFRGQGEGGGHAWFGYMEKPGRWNPDCGRYESQNYPVGEALNPQSWKPINDAELELLVGDLPQNPAYPAARAALAWAGVRRKKGPEAHLQAVREARKLLPAWPDPWVEEAALLEAAEPAVRKAFLQAWIQNFDKQTDLKVIGQQRLLEILRAENDPGVTALQKEIVRENRKKRFDLGIGAGADAVFGKIDGGDWEGAEKEFKSLVRKFDEQGGGNLFYQLIRPYVLSCVEDAQWERAEYALDYAEKKMDVGGRSILAREFSGLRLRVERKEQPPSNLGGL